MPKQSKKYRAAFEKIEPVGPAGSIFFTVSTAALAQRVNDAVAPRSYELLVVDDNSRDNTRAVCAE